MVSTPPLSRRLPLFTSLTFSPSSFRNFFYFSFTLLVGSPPSFSHFTSCPFSFYPSFPSPAFLSTCPHCGVIGEDPEMGEKMELKESTNEPKAAAAVLINNEGVGSVA